MMRAVGRPGILKGASGSNGSRASRGPTAREGTRRPWLTLRQGQGRIDEALQHYRRAVALSPGNADARRHLADLERQQK
ncbi:MAG: tetratricopeptide repeat protein [Vicinamibacterales bacterium]